MTIACSHCGTVQELPPVPGGSVALCPVCENHMERSAGRSLDAALACALGTLILLFPANLLPLMSVSLLGVTRTSRIGSGVVSLWQGHWVVVAALVGACVIILPFIRFSLLGAVLACLRFSYRPRWLGRAFRWAMALDFWAMQDVFLLGAAVGYSRVSADLDVTIGWGGICLIVAALLSMLSRASLDRRMAWRAIMADPGTLETDRPIISCTVCNLAFSAEREGSRCSRCDARLSARKPDSRVRTAALLIAGLALYVPANVFPMSTDLQLGEPTPHRIIDGIRELAQAGLWPLGLLIFCTSIAIPLLKLASLGWLLVSARMRSRRHLVFKTKLYRAVDEIGRWSSIDVFTIAVFLPLLQFGTLISSRADTGAPAFMLVVVLTMLASQTFDPRMVWDAAAAETA